MITNRKEDWGRGGERRGEGEKKRRGGGGVIKRRVRKIWVRMR